MMKPLSGRMCHTLAVGIAFLLAWGAVVSWTACRTHYSSIYPPRSPDYPIELTEYDYKEAYEELGQVKTRAYDDRLLETQGMSELRTIARQMGGDAVVRISRNSDVSEEIGYRPGALTRVGTKFVNKTALTGVVVRFKRVGTLSTPAPTAPASQPPAAPSSSGEKTDPVSPSAQKPAAALPAPPPVLPQPYEPPTPVGNGGK